MKILESILQGVPNVKPQNKVAAGFFLLMIYARAKFSDAQSSSTIIEDTIETDFGRDGFLKALAHRSKTPITLARKTRYIPMTASWLQAIKEADLPLGKGKPLLPPQSDAGWSSCPITAHVAAIWLKSLLRAGCAPAQDVIGYGTHSCKATVLSWAAKFGLDSNTRARLGYHSRGAGGTELVYARDRWLRSAPEGSQ